MEREIPAWLRSPLLGVYVRVFGCRMEEAVQQELAEYESFSALFTRQLRAGTRPVSTDSLVCVHVWLYHHHSNDSIPGVCMCGCIIIAGVTV